MGYRNTDQFVSVLRFYIKKFIYKVYIYFLFHVLNKVGGIKKNRNFIYTPPPPNRESGSVNQEIERLLP